MAVETTVEPDVAPTAPLNSKAPLASGALKIFGVEGVKEATYVPSPRYKDGRAVMQHMMDEKYGKGGTMSSGDDNWMLTHGGPFNADTVREIVNHPMTKVSDWASTPASRMSTTVSSAMASVLCTSILSSATSGQ
jgi:hypothetical protein